MRNKVQILLLLLFIGIAIQAQIPQLFKYQAVIRNTSGVILENQSVELTIRILQGSTDGTQVYSENHNVTTNSFGLVNLEIGSINTTDFAEIDWSNTPYFIELTIDGNVMGTSQLLSVPYALYANKAKEAENVFSGNYEDLSNQPDLSDTVNYLKNEVDPVFNQSLASKITENDTALWNNKSDFDGNYNNLSNIPDLSDTTNYIKTETDPIFSNSVANSITDADTLNWNHKSNFDGNYESLFNKPVPWDSTYSSIKSKPESISYFILDANKMIIANVATPKDSLDAANKFYIDSLMYVMDIKFLSITLAQGGDLATFVNSDLYSIEDLLKAGATPENLYNAGAEIVDLINSGSTINDLLSFGASVQELVDANVQLGVLLQAGITVSELLTAGVTASDLISAGVNVSELIANSVTIHGLTGILTDSIDNQTYNWIGIGEQVWMSENLNSDHFNNGEPLLYNNGADSANAYHNNSLNDCYFFYNNDSSNMEIYGKLYAEDVIYDTRNVCPSSWHVPNADEWAKLFIYLGISSTEATDSVGYIGTNEGGKLKTVETTYWNSPNTGATNEVSFNALPGGYFEPLPLEITEQRFYSIKDVAYFWLKEIPYTYPYRTVMLSSSSAQIYIRNEYVGTSGNSIRCVKD